MHFRILDLPPEPRHRIFTYALGGEIYPLSTAPLLHTIQPSSPNVPALQSGRLTLGLGYNDVLLKYGSPISSILHPSWDSRGYEEG